jgi:hypothetical protein
MENGNLEDVFFVSENNTEPCEFILVYKFQPDYKPIEPDDNGDGQLRPIVVKINNEDVTVFENNEGIINITNWVQPGKNELSFRSGKNIKVVGERIFAPGKQFYCIKAKLCTREISK